MPTHFTHPSVPNLYQRINKGDVAHRLALIAFTVDKGWGIATVEGSTGNALAWDGMYFDDLPVTTPLDELDWDEWDDMPSKLVFANQGPWLAGPLGFSLMPTYSVALKAANLVHGWGDDTQRNVHYLSGSTLRCYLPIADEATYNAEVQRLLSTPAEN